MEKIRKVIVDLLFISLGVFLIIYCGIMLDNCYNEGVFGYYSKYNGDYYTDMSMEAYYISRNTYFINANIVYLLKTLYLLLLFAGIILLIIFTLKYIEDFSTYRKYAKAKKAEVELKQNINMENE